MGTYKNFDKNRYIYFLKNKKFLINIMKFGKKVRIIIKKKINSKLVYNKKYLKAEKNQHKRKLSMLLQ